MMPRIGSTGREPGRRGRAGTAASGASAPVGVDVETPAGGSALRPGHDAAGTGDGDGASAGAGAEPRPGAFPGARVDWATVPRVNLLPQEIIDARRFRGVQRLLAGVVLVVLAFCGVATYWAQTGVTSARDALQLTRDETRSLQQQQTRYSEVPKVNAELEAARAARERVLGNDVLWYRFLTDLAVNTPDGTVLSTVAISLDSTPATTSADPLSAAGLGSVKISGKARRFTDVAAWLDAAGKVNGLGTSQLQSAARSGVDVADAEVTYAGSATITGAALSHRYDRKAS